MRPSIMSDGAMMSAPAAAWLSAWPTSTSTVSSLSDIAGLVEQPVLPVAGIGIERDVGQHADVVAAARR